MVIEDTPNNQKKIKNLSIVAVFLWTGSEAKIPALIKLHDIYYLFL